MLENISTVKDDVEDLHHAGYYNDKRSIILVIFPQAGSNVIKTTSLIHKSYH